MQVIVTRLFWIMVGLFSLIGVMQLVLLVNAWNDVEDAAAATASTAAITADTSAITLTAQNSLLSQLPVNLNGATLFNPQSDLQVSTVNQNQDTEVTLTYHVPILGPATRILGINATVPITRTVVRKNNYLHNGLHAIVTDTPNTTIGIIGVNMTINGGNINMTISGYGFGSAPAGVPGTTMGSFLTFTDSTQGWSAGSTTSGIPITYSSWSDNLINITGIQNLDKGTEVIRAGDNCSVTVTSSEGTNTYYFIANPGGETTYSVTLTASGQNVPMQTAVTLTANASAPGDGTDGVGIYDGTTGQYLNWSSAGDSITQLVNQGAPTSQDYVAYYGPQGNIGSALATSDDLGVSWGDVSSSGDVVSAVLYANQDGVTGTVDIFGMNMAGASVSMTGLTSSSILSANEMQAQVSSMNDTAGTVTLADGSKVPFTATTW